MNKQIDRYALAAWFLVGLIAVGGWMTWRTLATDLPPEIEGWIEGIKAAVLGLVLMGLLLAPVVLYMVYAQGQATTTTTRATTTRARPRQQTTAAGVPVWGLVRVQALTHNRETAEHLLQQYWQRHGQKGWSWVVEKCCYDLERDRR